MKCDEAKKRRSEFIQLSKTVTQESFKYEEYINVIIKALKQYIESGSGGHIGVLRAEGVQESSQTG